MSPLAGLILGLVLIVLNAFFVAAEFAIVKVRVTRIEELAKRGGSAARIAGRRAAALFLEQRVLPPQLRLGEGKVRLGFRDLRVGAGYRERGVLRLEGREHVALAHPRTGIHGSLPHLARDREAQHALAPCADRAAVGFHPQGIGRARLRDDGGAHRRRDGRFGGAAGEGQQGDQRQGDAVGIRDRGCGGAHVRFLAAEPRL